MEAQRQAAAEKIPLRSVKIENIPSFVEISSGSEKSLTGRAQEPGEEVASSLKRSASLQLTADHVHKRACLQPAAVTGNTTVNNVTQLNTTATDFADGFGKFDGQEGGNLLYDDRGTVADELYELDLREAGNVQYDVKLESDALEEGRNTPPGGHIVEDAGVMDKDDDLPDDFLEPLDSPLAASPLPIMHSDNPGPQLSRDTVKAMSRQFWKAGDYDSGTSTEDMDFANGVEHIRVHPKFLHSNATSHKWALGAIAELLDNALDEAVNGATFVSVDMVHNPRDGCPMLVIEDDGGGMDPEHLRQCMSLGYSSKSKVPNTIGQYGNGFKTSTMRLGADVLVFSRNKSKDGSLPTQSIGLLSYTFLMATGQNDIVVPMVDYEVQPFGLKKLVRGTLDDWNRNFETLLQWSPYNTEQGLFGQLQRIKDQGTIVIVYNLWENDEGELELDFDADPDDIQLRGTNRDNKSILMASKYPHSKHFFTHKYSLRSYASILYLRLPKKFRIFLRGKQVIHHKLVSDLMLVEQVKYKPLKVAVLSHKDAVTVVTLGFVKHAKEHIDVQGFNVYHKNRLIKPFWRIWINPGINGRGIFGVLEANFVEPAHDKQGFERTTVFARLEARLLEIQKSYWAKNLKAIGYRANPAKIKAPSKAGVAAVGQSGKGTSNPATPSSAPTTLISPRSTQKTVHMGSVIPDKDQVKVEHSDGEYPLALLGREALPSQHMTQFDSTSHASELLHGNHNNSQSESATVSLGDPEEAVKSSLSGLGQGEKAVLQMTDLACAAAGLDSNLERSTTDRKPGTEELTSLTVLKNLECIKGSLSEGNQENVFSKKDQPPDMSLVSGPVLLDVSGPSLQAALMSESRQDSNEALVSPSSQCDMAEPSQCTSRDEVNVATQPDQPRTLTRSMLQLRQSHAKAARLESANMQQTQEPTTSSVTNLNSLVKASLEDGAPSVTTLASPVADNALSLESINDLESKLYTMKHRWRDLQSDLNKAYRERDFLKRELEEERRRQSLIEDELKKRLQALVSKASELESSNMLLQACQR
ncbi:hypothetical protein L7F22_001654 [Adiantum nelumboides]|nr:hypothetical protein [Adiantum nelumboides]